jgi:hypothetical protein
LLAQIELHGVGADTAAERRANQSESGEIPHV